jgi:hypothetical protein
MPSGRSPRVSVEVHGVTALMRVAGDNRGPVPERLRCLQVVLATDGAELEAGDESGYTAAVRPQAIILGSSLEIKRRKMACVRTKMACVRKWLPMSLTSWPRS